MNVNLLKTYYFLEDIESYWENYIKQWREVNDSSYVNMGSPFPYQMRIIGNQNNIEFSNTTSIVLRSFLKDCYQHDNFSVKEIYERSVKNLNEIFISVNAPFSALDVLSLSHNDVSPYLTFGLTLINVSNAFSNKTYSIENLMLFHTLIFNIDNKKFYISSLLDDLIRKNLNIEDLIR